MQRKCVWESGTSSIFESRNLTCYVMMIQESVRTYQRDAQIIIFERHIHLSQRTTGNTSILTRGAPPHSGPCPLQPCRWTSAIIHITSCSIQFLCIPGMNLRSGERITKYDIEQILLRYDSFLSPEQDPSHGKGEFGNQKNKTDKCGYA